MRASTVALLGIFLLVGGLGGSLAVEQVSLESDGSASGSAETFRPGAETRTFEAETNRLLDILIHSLYSNKDIFLREVISNAADALDKARFQDLRRAAGRREVGGSDPTVAEESLPEISDALAARLAATPLEIRIEADPARGVLSIVDSGVGMTRAQMVDNLGTIAKSGTGAFLEAAQREGGDAGALIGQFGVGFYSVYLVADYVSVTSRVAGGRRHVWESRASGVFAVSDDDAALEDGVLSPADADAGQGEPAPDARPLLGPRGTRIDLHLKPEAADYLVRDRLVDIVRHHSEFVPFPIYLRVDGEEGTAKDQAASPLDRRDAADEDDEEEAFPGGDDGNDEEEAVPEADEDAEADAEAAAPAWKRLNEAKAVWLRPPAQVTEDEHAAFFRALTRAGPEAPPPLAHVHFHAEGDAEFRALLYVPSVAPPAQNEDFYAREASVRLYVRRVLVGDKFDGLLPRWLNFVAGLVDSDTLPINVSREVLRTDAGVKVIRKKLVRKITDALLRLSRAEVEARGTLEDLEAKAQAGDADAATALNETRADLERDVAKYGTFWQHFGRQIKMGLIEEREARKRLLPLLRFTTNRSPDTPISLDEYVKRMVPGQTRIYFLVGLGKREVVSSPYLEALEARNVEVVTFVDALDEYLMAHVNEYEDHEFVNAARDDLKLDEIDQAVSKDEAKASDEASDKALTAAQMKKLTGWFKRMLRNSAPGEGVETVRASKRLARRPCVVVASRHGWTAQMERIARAQAMGEGEERARYMRGGRILELNPEAPIVRRIAQLVRTDPNDQLATHAARALFDTCLVESGYVIDDMAGFTERIQDFIARGLETGHADEAAVEQTETKPAEAAQDETIQAESIEAEPVEAEPVEAESVEAESVEAAAGEHDEL